MKKKLKVLEPAIKYNSKVVKGTPKESHDQIAKENGKPKKAGKRGFILSDGEYVDRRKAAKVARKAKQVAHPGKELHSHELRMGKKDK